jgi:hypothetical protein
MDEDDLLAAFQPQIDRVKLPCNLFLYVVQSDYVIQGGWGFRQEWVTDVKAVTGLNVNLNFDVHSNDELFRFSILWPNKDLSGPNEGKRIWRGSQIAYFLPHHDKYELVDYIGGIIPRFKRIK